MCLRQILVFADKERNVIPEVFVEVTFHSVSDGLRLANINGTLSCFWISASEKVNARVL